MKKLALLVLAAISVTGCQAIRTEMEQQEALKISCEDFATVLKRDSVWLESCLTGDPAVFAEAMRAKFQITSQDQLCGTVLWQYQQPVGDLAQQVATERKIDCNPIITASVREGIKSKASIDTVCSVWYEKNMHPALMAEVNKEVADKKLDCIQVVNAQRQTEAMRMQAAAAESQAAAARSAAAAAWSAGFQQNMNANRPRTCNTFGNTTTCY